MIVHGEVFVSMDPHITLQNGDKGALPCRVDRQVHSVTWSKGHVVQTADVLLLMQFDDKGSRKAGQGYVDGLYDIDANFTLFIHHVNVTNNGLYFCEILDLESGQNYLNYTDVNVFGMLANRELLWGGGGGVPKKTTIAAFVYFVIQIPLT